jgi:hypothetical protein
LAFTDAQKDDIRGYLGYSLGFYQYNTPLESMIDKVGGVPSEQAKVQGILTELALVDAAVAASGSSSMTAGMVKKADEIEFYNAEESSGAVSLIGAVKRGRMLIGRLAVALGGRDIIKDDYFATATGANSFDLSMG